MRRASTLLVVLLAAFAAVSHAGEDHGVKVISAAFEEKGMDRTRSYCFGDTIAEHLNTDDTKRAAKIVRDARNEQEIEDGVKDGGLEFVLAFLAANANC